MRFRKFANELTETYLRGGCRSHRHHGAASRTRITKGTRWQCCAGSGTRRSTVVRSCLLGDLLRKHSDRNSRRSAGGQLHRGGLAVESFDEFGILEVIPPDIIPGHQFVVSRRNPGEVERALWAANRRPRRTLSIRWNQCHNGAFKWSIVLVQRIAVHPSAVGRDRDFQRRAARWAAETCRARGIRA